MLHVNLRGHEVFLTDEIKDYAEKKLNKLCKKYKFIIEADAVLEENHNKKESTAAYISVTLRIPGKDIVAKSESRTIFGAIDEVERKLRRQLEKDKQLHHDPSDSKFSESKNIIRRIFRRE